MTYNQVLSYAFCCLNDFMSFEFKRVLKLFNLFKIENKKFSIIFTKKLRGCETVLFTRYEQLKLRMRRLMSYTAPSKEKQLLLEQTNAALTIWQQFIRLSVKIITNFISKTIVLLHECPR